MHSPAGRINPGGVLCCGNTVLDILVRPVVEPGWGRTTWVESIEQQLGGNGANTAYTLERMGVPVRLVSAVGGDAFGERALATLNSAGVNTGWVARLTEPTPTTVALIRSDGSRALLHQPGASRQAFGEPVALSPELIQACSRFHLANVFALPKLQPHASDLLRRAQSAGLTTSLDTGWDAQGRWMATLRECLQYTDLLFVNEDEAMQLTGLDDPAQAARILQNLGAHNVVVKLGAAGCLVATPHEHFRAAGFPVAAVDTTGAGDCFVGGFLAALQRGFSYSEAARFANAVGALSVQAMGGVTGLLTFDRTVEWINSYDQFHA